MDGAHNSKDTVQEKNNVLEFQIEELPDDLRKDRTGKYIRKTKT